MVNMEVAHKLQIYPPLGIMNAIEVIKAGKPGVPAGMAVEGARP